MRQRRDHEFSEDELFLAGEKVRPGTYRQVGGEREVLLEQEDFLPASLDGRVACYMRVNNTWAEMSSQMAGRG
jgi:hypothetical protein